MERERLEADVPTEAEFEASPEAVAGRARLEAGLEHLAPAELEAFWEAVRRCYGGGTQEGEAPE